MHKKELKSVAWIKVDATLLSGGSTHHRMRQVAIPTFHFIIFTDAPIAEARVTAHEYCGFAPASGIFLLPRFLPRFVLDPASRGGFSFSGFRRKPSWPSIQHPVQPPGLMSTVNGSPAIRR
ncbi:MAG: hypothetical protein ACJ8EW_29715 [Rhizobium sp.]|uniref:hypothetical protein n=1 Tax=Rhizobium TaxID=379 RepID=UPI001C98DCEA|nr:hypothetical protein [Rhizobium leguminosarum]MBY5347967.1 hypothetical protein [Rhizobium leguminosarum]